MGVLLNAAGYASADHERVRRPDATCPIRRSFLAIGTLSEALAADAVLLASWTRHGLDAASGAVVAQSHWKLTFGG
jgi:hypothetical protein